MGASAYLRKVKPISKYQFALFRIVLGVYLTIHFAMLIPYAEELFSRDGLLPDSAANFTSGILPNPLAHWGSARFATTFLIVLTILSLSLTVGLFRPVVAVLIWYGSACLFNRNNLISNPSIPYIGMLLLICAAIPTGEPWSIVRKRVGTKWSMPAILFWTPWILMTIGYSYSGLDKLLSSPSWRDGTALTHVLNLPLARPGIFRDLALGMPEICMKLLTWGVLALEVLFLPLCLHRRSRAIAWTLMLVMHVGIVTMISFADLSLGMIVLHVFTFDPDWCRPRTDAKGSTVVLFDDVCILCNGAVQFLLEEDWERLLKFAPLNGDTARAAIGRHPELESVGETILLVENHETDDEIISTHSTAALKTMDRIGGLWRLLSWSRIVPQRIRDHIYKLIASHRYDWFGKLDTCPVPTPEIRDRFLA